MSDPAIEAAHRAWEYAHPTHREDRWTVMKAASHEALTPIRNLIDKYESDPIGGFSLDDFLTELRPLIYPSEEL